MALNALLVVVLMPGGLVQAAGAPPSAAFGRDPAPPMAAALRAVHPPPGGAVSTVSRDTVALAAQHTAGATTGAITGVVTDATGAAVPAATIEVSSGALMGVRTIRTGADGSYRVPALPPGEYRLVISQDGFATARREEIHVPLGFTATVNVELELAAFIDTVLVSPAPQLFDTQSVTVATHFSARELADLPSARTMWSLQAFTPGVRLGAVDVGGSAAATPSATIAYGTSGLNRPTVEGISITGVNPIGFTLDYGSFGEVSVRTAAHDPEWHTPGVHVQFISKSGGNRYRGTIYTDYERRGWQWFNIDEAQTQRGVGGGGGLAPRDTNQLWSYRDRNADIGGYIVKDRLWWYASVRRQDVASRRVNFPVEPYRTLLTNYTGKVSYRVAPGHHLVVFAQTGRNRQPTLLDPFGPGGSGLAAATALNESRESTAAHRSLGWIGKVEWNAIAGDASFFEVRAGQFGGNRRERPNGTGPRFEDVGTLLVSGGGRDWERRFRRTQVIGAVSRYHRDRTGHHQLKAGGEVFLTTDTEIWTRGYGDDVLHVLRHGVPIEVYLFQTPSRAASGLWTYSAHVGDAWQVNRRLTVNLGVRADRYRVFLPEQDHPAGVLEAHTFPAVDTVILRNVIVPRLGTVYDPTGEGRTLVKVSYGQYGIGPGTQLGLAVNPNAAVWWQRYEWLDPDSSGLWEPGEEGRELGRRGGVATESLHPALRLPRISEAGGWIEHGLAARIGVRTGLVWRGSRNHFTRRNVSQPFEAFTVPVTILDPGPDGVPGTADDGAGIQGYGLAPAYIGLPAVHVVDNVPGSREQHWTWEISATRRASRRWSMTAAFSHTWHREHAAGYLGQPVRNNPYPLTPNDWINTDPEGRHVFRTWTAKAFGTYAAPWDVRVTPLLRHQSGQPFGRTIVTTLPGYGSLRILAEPVGVRRTDHVTVIDARVEKGVRFSDSLRVAAFADIFNLLNANPELNVNWASGHAFLRPLAILPPRIARIGLRVDW